jgi:hypothetical protein
MKREFVSLITENVLDLFADQKSFKWVNSSFFYRIKSTIKLNTLCSHSSIKDLNAYYYQKTQTIKHITSKCALLFIQLHSSIHTQT